jgi:hypothetical protein
VRYAILLLTLICAPAWAACSGSGLTWTCTAGSTAANVKSAVDSSSDGATITLADGSYTWSGPVDLVNANGVTIICESVRGCTINYTSGAFYRDYFPSNVTNLMRISGFILNGDPGTATIWLYGNEDMTNLRIDNNTFQGQSGTTISILLGEISSTGNAYGVIDNNIFTGANNYLALKDMSGGAWSTGLKGSASNIFFEDNTITFTTNSNLGAGGLDAWKGSSVVFRYNSLTNSRYVNHSLCHGGPVSVEVYGNTITSPTGDPVQYRNIHMQGSGESIVFDNTVSGSSGGHIALQHYRSDSSQMPQGECTAAEVCDGDWTATSGNPLGDGNRSGQNGYPCWRQPGRDGNAEMKPVYFFKNRNTSGTLVEVSIESGGLIDSHLLEDRDWFEAVSASAQSSSYSPFNGTTGVGHGTLANRPSTCTTFAAASPHSAVAGKSGVGYWATDAGGNWNTSNGTSDDGALYVCTATNTWTLYYTPYTYPHPLRGGEVVRPNPPTNIVVTQVTH